MEIGKHIEGLIGSYTGELGQPNKQLIKQKWLSQFELQHDVTIEHSKGSAPIIPEEIDSSNFNFEHFKENTDCEHYSNKQNVIAELEHLNFIYNQSVVYKAEGNLESKKQYLQDFIIGTSQQTSDKNLSGTVTKDSETRESLKPQGPLLDKFSSVGNPYLLTNTHITRQGNKITLWIRDFKLSHVEKAREILELLVEYLNGTDYEVENVMFNGRPLIDFENQINQK